jgi:hypothetical protein
MEKEPVDIRWANFLLPNKQAVYDKLLEDKLFLPKIESKACTNEYIMRVATGKVFRLSSNQIGVCNVKRKCSKAELISILEKDLGFDLINPPDKSWLISCIHALRPSHGIFKKYS